MPRPPRRTARTATRLGVVATVVAAALTTAAAPAAAGHRSCNLSTGVCTIQHNGLTDNRVRGANYTVSGNIQVASSATVSADKRAFTFAGLSAHVVWYVTWNSGVTPPPLNWDVQRRVTFNGATAISTSTPGWNGMSTLSATETTTRGVSGNALVMNTNSTGWVQLPTCKWIYDPGPVLMANAPVQNVSYNATSNVYFPDAPFTLSVADSVTA